MKINLNRIFYVKKSSSCMNKDGNILSVYSIKLPFTYIQ